MLTSFLLLLLFMGLQGMFAGMETGMISVRRPRIEHASERGRRSAGLLLFFLNNPGVMISTTLLGVNISVVCASLAAKTFAEQAGLSSAGALLAMSSLLSVGMLICEIIPKNWFRQAPCDRCGRFAWLLYGTYLVLYFPAKAFDWFTSFLSRRISKSSSDNNTKLALMREDLKLFLMESESSGVLPPEAATILDNAAGFHAACVGNIMKYKVDMVTVDANLNIAEAMELCRKKEISKFPVCDPQTNEWIGIFSIYHVLFSLKEEKWNATPVRECMQELIEVDEKVPLIEMLKRTRGLDVAMYVVLRNGKQTGALTSSDIVHRLFG